jgi:hypothetical protein
VPSPSNAPREPATPTPRAWDRSTLVAYLVQRYAAGGSLAQLSEETSRSFGHVRRLLIDAGVTMRPRGGSRPRTT